MNCTARSLALVLLSVTGLFAGATRVLAAEPVSKEAAARFFETRVRPVLVARCYECHGPDSEVAGGLRVDSLSALLAGGDRGPAIKPGEPQASLLIAAVNHGEVVQMPPKSKLPAQEIADLTAWIADGATWPDSPATNPADKSPVNKAAPGLDASDREFWSFQPPQEPAVPAVRDAAWPRTSIDRFILSALESRGLKPAPGADKRVLIRRATFDLHGLPPTVAEVEQFVADETPGAFARLIDRLLASPRYGQRWGRHWLDIARYADSNGMDENMAMAHAWRYRDYVIAALNDDMPYDQFVREQIAGDLLPATDDAARFRQLTATGFLVLGPKMLAEDDPVKMEMDIIDEQVDTIGRAFMGLTLGCARCHDHKFDPISTADYYALAGIFKSTRSMENHRVVAMWAEQPLASQAQQTELADWQRDSKRVTDAIKQTEAKAQEQLLNAARARAADYLRAAATQLDRRRSQLEREKELSTGALGDGSLVVEAENFTRGNVVRDFETYGSGIGVIYNAGPLPNQVEYDFELPAAGTYQLALRFAAAEPRPVELSLDQHPLAAQAAGKTTGSWQPDSQTWSIVTAVPLASGKHTLRMTREGPFPHFDKWGLLPMRWKDGAGAAQVVSTLQSAEQSGLSSLFLEQWVDYLDRTRDEPNSLLKLWQTSQEGSDAIDQALEPLLTDGTGPFAVPKQIATQYPADTKQELDRLKQESAGLEKAKPELDFALAVSDQKPQDLRVHLRGSHLTLGELSPRRFPRVITTEQPTLGDQSSGRLELARWLTRADHPLTTRVIVNRIWQGHFGEGLVRSPDNFGKLGEAPDNQPLLDHLARSLVASGWSLKALHRQIMLSSAYQMSTAFDAQAAEADPQNRLLWRMNRRRLAAEEIRDAILATSSALDEAIGGTLLANKNHTYVTSTASKNDVRYDNPRRSVYLPVIRSAVYDVFQAFDFADPSTMNGRRPSTTVAPQALFMLNGPLVLRQSKALAEELLSHGEVEDAARVSTAYQRAYSRAAGSAEIARSLEFVRRYETDLVAAKVEPNEAHQRAWQALCRVIFASNEFVFVE